MNSLFGLFQVSDTFKGVRHLKQPEQSEFEEEDAFDLTFS